MIGDRINTDIAFGKMCGVDTCMTLTGIGRIEEFEEYQKEGRSEELPDFYLEKLSL